MKGTKILSITMMMVTALSLTSCSSSEPEWTDPEAHEKTEQLREQNTPFIVGAFLYKNIAFVTKGSKISLVQIEGLIDEQLQSEKNFICQT